MTSNIIHCRGHEAFSAVSTIIATTMAADPITNNTINDLLSYDFSDDGDPFNEKSKKKRDDKSVLSPRGTKRAAEDANKENFGGLGLDEEVKITKKRIPNPKLDDQRLLSEPGIPKLRALARSGRIAKKLHFKGKGHEFSDVAKLLSYYQLWLDDLFPRAKFADGLMMVEKVGHSKRMALMRKEWIDEGKPGYARDKALRKEQEEHEKSGDGEEVAAKATDGNTEESDDIFFADSNQPKEQVNDNQPEDDDLDALLAEQAARVSPQKTTRNVIDSEGEDDLDALLAEQDTNRRPLPVWGANGKNEAADGDDDLDALIAEQESRSAASAPARSKPRNTVFDEDDEDEDDLDALLAEQETRKEPELPPAPISFLNGISNGMKSPEPALEESTQEQRDDMLSSPLPNNPEQEDLEDFLSSPIPNDE